MLFISHHTVRGKWILSITIVSLFLIAWSSLNFFAKQRRKTIAEVFPGGISKTPPNILLIVTDDQDCGSFRYMPKLSGLLVNKGVTFANTFVASPVCIPSRASILLGQYVHRHGVTNDSSDFQTKHYENQTIAARLQAAGYETILVGKYFNGSYKPAAVPPGWDQWYGILTDNQYYNYTLNENGRQVFYADRPEDYISDVLTDKAVLFLENRKNDKPFFMYLNTVAPHSPATPAPQYRKSSEYADPVQEYEQDLSDKPAWVRDFTTLNAEFLARTTDLVAPWLLNRYRTLLSVDDMVEALVRILDAQGELENTYVFYISDNGDGMMSHIPVSAKLAPYEEGIRVPFLVRGPGVPEDVTLPHLVSATDLFPTIAELAGIPVPPETDGMSLVPLLKPQPVAVADWRDEVVVELGEIKEWPWKSIPPQYRLLRTVAYKYIEYRTGEREYYDLVTDPGEMDNIFQRLELSTREELARTIARRAPWPDFDRPAN